MDVKSMLLPIILSNDSKSFQNLLPILLNSLSLGQVSDEKFAKFQQFAEFLSKCTKEELLSMLSEATKTIEKGAAL